MITLTEQIDAVRREIALRERFYPGWVSAKKLKLETADHEIAAMRAVLTTLEELRERG